MQNVQIIEGAMHKYIHLLRRQFGAHNGHDKNYIADLSGIVEYLFFEEHIKLQQLFIAQMLSTDRI